MNKPELKELLYTLEQGPMQVSSWINEEAMRKYLADDFKEFGSSGSVYTLSDYEFGNKVQNEIDIEIIDFDIEMLAQDVVLATYKSIKHHEENEEMKYSLRSSIWKFNGTEWKMVFHQGTRTGKICSQRSKKMNVVIKEITDNDRNFITNYLSKEWGSSIIVTRGKIHSIDKLSGFIALIDDEIKGIVTYSITESECEIVSLNSLLEKQGIGTLLLNKVTEKAKSDKCKRVWLITTNDNIEAIGFYQKRRYDMVAIHRNAIAESRKIKPQISLYGFDEIPIKHEIEFELIVGS